MLRKPGCCFLCCQSELQIHKPQTLEQTHRKSLCFLSQVIFRPDLPEVLLANPQTLSAVNSYCRDGINSLNIWHAFGTGGCLLWIWLALQGFVCWELGLQNGDVDRCYGTLKRLDLVDSVGINGKLPLQGMRRGLGRTELVPRRCCYKGTWKDSSLPFMHSVTLHDATWPNGASPEAEPKEEANLWLSYLVEIFF